MLSALNDGDVRSKTLLKRLVDQPKSPAIIGVAEVLCEQGRYREAITRLRSVAEFYGDVYRFNLVLARACRDAGEMELAKQHYEKACRIAPQNEVAIKELIALTAFPHAAPKPLPRDAEPPVVRETASTLASPLLRKSEPQAPEPEVPSVFKLDREKLSKALGGVIGSAEKSDAQPIETQKPPSSTPAAGSSVVEAFRKADNLLEQEPDIDALAREMMSGNAFVVQKNPVQEKLPEEPSEDSKTDVANKQNEASLENALQQVAAPRQQSIESEEDIDAIARQMLGMGVSNEPVETASTSQSQVSPITSMPMPPSTASAPKPIPLDESGNPIIKIDRNKLTQALSGIYRAKGIAPSATEADAGEDDDTPFPMPAKADTANIPTPTPLASPPSPAQSKGTLSFEEEIMAMQMQGGDIDAFISNKDTAHREQESDMKSPATSPSDEYDIEALAREIMSAQLPKVEETNDPTPVSEQRQPFSDDDIKTPTRQLAKIFQAQGAYAKAIKVYEMLSEREPENASLYEILIGALREKMNAQ